jgi:drug/metabolite transporter (DMT)-like permease
MLDAWSAIALGLVTGGVGGAFSAYLGWNRSGEPFDGRKFIDGLATGVLAGLALGFANLAVLKGAVDEIALMTTVGTIFFGALGVDFVREHVSGIVEKKKPI